MKRTINRTRLGAGFFTCVLLLAFRSPAEVIFEKFSPYHHVQVIEDNWSRMLSFNGTWETRMSLTNPLTGHFEYTEFFHTPWLWNHDLKRVLMIGLGGGSTQRSYLHYYTNVLVDTVEIDPVVIDAAKKYFTVTGSPRHVIHNLDGRVFIRRTTNRYDAIIMDAYTSTRYGSSIPPHLVTKEFFALASDCLTTNGVLAYNVIGQIQGLRAGIVPALYRTLKEVFPQVYLFPAVSSRNVVLVATKSRTPFDAARIQQEGAELIRSGAIRLPTFAERLRCFIDAPPPAAARSPVLTDNHAPVDSLMNSN